MEDFSLKPYLLTGTMPSLVILTDSPSISMKHPGAIKSSLTMEIRKKLLKLLVEIEDPPLACLGFPRIKPNDPLMKIHFIPGEARDLSNSPSSMIPEGKNWLEILWQGLQESKILAMLEEPRPDIDFSKHRDMGDSVHLRWMPLRSQTKHPLKNG
jgi:hypothetical protein